MNGTLTRETLVGRLHYEPATGVFTRRADLIGRFKGKGRVVGSLSHGYLTTRLDGRVYRLSRLAWLYVTGSHPDGVIDHINGDPADNRWVNLRCVDQKVNTQNQRRARSNNSTRLLGVTHAWRANKSKPYAASIQVDGRARHLGYFASPQEAHKAYKSAKRKLHEGCTI